MSDAVVKINNAQKQLWILWFEAVFAHLPYELTQSFVQRRPL